MTVFRDLGLIEPLLTALDEEGYTAPTPIQAQSIPPLLAGRDVLGCAQTGTGKTAAFALPVLQHLAASAGGARRIRALVLSPTRELAAQIGDSFVAYGRHLPVRSMVIFGGVNENPQIRELKKPLDVLIATPGRLLDLVGRGFIDLGGVDFFVLDEADRMLDMGFIHDIRRVLRVLPAKRQNLLFSATMPGPIAQLASSFLHDPVRVEVTPQSTTVERIDQSVLFVDKADKRRLIAELLSEPAVERAIVFTRTKHGANRLVQHLERDGIVSAAIHGNKSQNARERALDGFRGGSIRVLVATDLASRGLDVDDVTHVFNFELPNEPESYVHRIGRTGRAGRAGIAVSLIDPEETEYLEAIQRTIGEAIPAVLDHPYHCAAAMPRPRGAQRPSGGGGGGARPSSTSAPGGANRSAAARPAGGPPRQAAPPRPAGQQPQRAAGGPQTSGPSAANAASSAAPGEGGAKPRRRRRRGGAGRSTPPAGSR
ncbi:MAG: DEAD/DEAH box helicase [Myxococcales bacterium]|nr:DEAD/DEAH box helicase [Myxococcales bacterium]